MENVSFNRPTIVGRELEYIQQALESGHISGNGDFTKRCERLLQDELGVPRALLTTSCTHALEMAALLLDIRPGDEVIVPSFTFVSTVNAFVLRGARPVFIDIRPDTLNMDEALLEELITPKTKAIVPVHYAGVGCEMDSIGEIAQRHGIPVVEDNAQGLLGRYKKHYLGTFGALAAQSFHETKNITCGEGGALLINDAALIERAEIIREKGTNRAQFFRGEIDKYTWRDLGSSYLPSDILAAVLYAQLEKRHEVQESRRRLWTSYRKSLSAWAADHGVALPFVPPYCEQTFHIFYLILRTAKDSSMLISALRRAGIQAVFHYQPLHLSTMGLQWGYRRGELPVTERVCDCLVRLPLHIRLDAAAQGWVCEAIEQLSL